MENEIIKCLKCNQVLISGSGACLMFGPGASIKCGNCGNKYTFGERHEKQVLQRHFDRENGLLDLQPMPDDCQVSIDEKGN